jgi:hypothetical protein
MPPKKRTSARVTNTNSATDRTNTGLTMMDIDDTSELGFQETANQGATIHPAAQANPTTAPGTNPVAPQMVNSANNSALASDTTVGSARMVVSEEEMKTKLQTDIEELRRQLYNATQASVITPIDNPSSEAMWAQECKLRTKLTRTIETYKSIFGCEPVTASTKLPIPPNLSLWQWKSKVFDKTKHIYETPDDCVSDFENILQAHKRPINVYWKEYVITVLPGPILAWYNKFSEQKAEITWDNFKTSFIEYYGINPIVQKENALHELINLEYTAKKKRDSAISRLSFPKLIKMFWRHPELPEFWQNSGSIYDLLKVRIS